MAAFVKSAGNGSSRGFRTIQVCPKDLRALPGQPEPAVSWHSGFRGGAHARPKTTPVHHAPWRRGGLAARGARQQPAMPVIGFLDATTAVESVYRVSAFRDGLKEAGFIDGHNVAIEFHWAENKLDRLSTLAADVVHRQVAFIVGPITAMRMARNVSSTIPIVFVSGGDPIAIGVVTNLSRPGGNITGVSFASAPLQPKRLGLLHELIPPSATIAWLRDPRGPGFEEEEKEVPPAARELGHQLLALNAQSAGEIDAAFASIVQSRAGALLIGADILFNN